MLSHQVTGELNVMGELRAEGTGHRAGSALLPLGQEGEMRGDRSIDSDGGTKLYSRLLFSQSPAGSKRVVRRRHYNIIRNQLAYPGNSSTTLTRSEHA